MNDHDSSSSGRSSVASSMYWRRSAHGFWTSCRSWIRAQRASRASYSGSSTGAEFTPQPPPPFERVAVRRRRVDPVTVWAWVGALSFCAGVWGIAITWLVER